MPPSGSPAQDFNEALLKPPLYSARMESFTVQALPNTATTGLVLDQIPYDIGGLYVRTPDGRDCLKAPISGQYEIGWSHRQATGLGTIYYEIMAIDSQGVTRILFREPIIDGGPAYSLDSRPTYLFGGEEVSARVYNDSGGSRNTDVDRSVEFLALWLLQEDE